MKIVVIGSVAAGTSVAAKARRGSEEHEIIVYERGEDISYSSCGLPYYIGSEDITRADLTPRNPQWFAERYNIDIKTGHEVKSIDSESKTVLVQELATGAEEKRDYDICVIATGASSVIPPVPGIDADNIFTVRNVKDADKIRHFIDGFNPGHTTIIGSGFIGMEMIENLVEKGINVTVIEKASSIMPALDEDMSVYLKLYLQVKGVQIITDDSVQSIENNGTTLNLERGNRINTDMVIVAAGVKPEVSLAKTAGVTLGETGAISVNKKMETNLPDIYAVGDCAESFSLITGSPLYRPLGSTANKMGRICGANISGLNMEFRGILGTGIFKIFNMAVGYTGLNEWEAVAQGFDVEVIHNIKPDKSEYFPGSSQLIIKGVADRKNGKILGVQVIGEQGVDKRIDTFVTAITYGATAEDLFHLDLAYAPPFSTTKDPVMYTGMVLENAIHTNRKLITPDTLEKRRAKGEKITVIDVRKPGDFEKGHIPGAVNLPLAGLRESLGELTREETIVVHCNKGASGDAAQNILLNNGYNEVYNLSGGFKNYSVQTKK